MKFNFCGFYLKKDKADFKIAQEQDLRRICKYLKSDFKAVDKKINFKVFNTREGKQQADPNHSISRASARFDEMTVYRFWIPSDDPHFPHEITHLVAHTWNKPYLLETELDTWDNKKIKRKLEMVSTSFIQEGLSIALDDIVFNRKLMEDGEFKLIDDWCRQQIDKVPTISQAINLDGFISFENKLIVPFAASFSKYLLLKYGVDKYKKMYVKLKETLSVKQNVKIIEDIYQFSEQKLLTDWKISLN